MAMVLIIEGNDNNAALIMRVLSQQVPPPDVRHLTTPEEVIALLQGLDGEAVELVLLDLHLPTGPGFEILRQLRALPQTSHTPIVVMSNLASDDEVARCYDLGANSFILTSKDTEELEYIIGHVASYWLALNQPYVLPGVKR